MAKRKLNYKETLEELELIAQRIKNEEIPIEELPDVIQRAKSLVQICSDMLRNAENSLKDAEL